jgi:hypothetical protein
LFVVTVTDAAGQPVAFTSPVHLTVQFTDRPDPAQTDVVRMNGWPGWPEAMKPVRDTEEGEAVDFEFVYARGQTADTAQGTVTVQNYVGLTGVDGMGTWGVVSRTYSLDAPRWQLYR